MYDWAEKTQYSNEFIEIKTKNKWNYEQQIIENENLIILWKCSEFKITISTENDNK